MTINRTIHFVFLLSFCLSISLYGQTEKNLDSLIDLSYEELFEKLNNSKTINDGYLYSFAYLNKAKANNDSIKICNGFTQIISISDKYESLKYCDSIINYSKNSPSNEYPTWGYLQKGSILFDIGQYEESLLNYSLAYQSLIKNENDFYLHLLNDQIGQMKVFWGDSNDAVNIFRSQLQIIENEKLLNNVNYRLDALHNISNAFIIEKQIDSAYKYNLEGLKVSLANPETNHYPYFLVQSGEIIFYKKKYKQSKDSLLKSITLNDGQFSLENTYTILGQIELKLKDSLASYNYFKSADSIVEKNQDYTPDTKIIYSFLKDYSLINGDKKSYHIYSAKLQKTDSALTENYKLVNRKLIEDFEIPKIVIEKNDTIKSLEEKAQKKKVSSGKILAVLATLLVIVAFVYVGRKRFLQKKKEDPLRDMNPDVVKKIMKQLDNFEKKKTFTNKRYNLKTISKKFQTNSSYLSKVINAKKGKNVSNYLSDLRIKYCIQKIRTDKTYLAYDVKSLATEFGFNNAESFSKAFSAKTGYTPAAYIQIIKNRNNPKAN